MRLSQEAKSTIKMEIHRTLQRMRGVLQCPISIGHHVKLWESQYSAEDLKARDHVLVKGFARESDLNSPRVIYAVGEHTVQVYHDDDVFLTSYEEYHQYDKGNFPKSIVRTVLGEDGEQLLQWMQSLAEAQFLAKEVQIVAEEVLDMANTAGQLARMVPELQPFLGVGAASSVLQQQASSRLPIEWAAYDRDRLSRAMNFLTKCSLLEPVEYRQHEDNVFGFKTSEPHLI